MKILLLSDLHGKKGALQSILADENASRADLVVLAGDLTTLASQEESEDLLGILSIKPFLCIPGNMDSNNTLKAMEETGNSIHLKSIKKSGKQFAGMGGGLIGGAGEIVFSEEEIAKKLGVLAQNSDILVSHLPPKNSKLDFSGVEHIGCSAVRKIIEEKKPKIFLCGHAHDSRNIEWIGKTLCVNAGPAKLGCFAVIDVDKMKAELF